mmetsp:Transcript_19044/g.29454  ORF Transcript_19044/g.29454 Transcript_19044/m.29454 type:complete len:840 (+) Transcript_19044:137-2656(+)|eukprot:CAMPEP_0196805498 /NCGR_PEP_ID=MMETSP1362-20130617/5270_1 /TAXON_ID=163516 /ORGANISM="Leptocylindrus danicus, Strain CCMP1856" /LENGTH=839 /DNA_ID=CAMNT_0042178469 /DNA_START=129 /DNA_END=2648 /DNA_ORIENTATION=+
MVQRLYYQLTILYLSSKNSTAFTPHRQQVVATPDWNAARNKHRLFYRISDTGQQNENRNDEPEHSFGIDDDSAATPPKLLNDDKESDAFTSSNDDIQQIAVGDRSILYGEQSNESTIDTSTASSSTSSGAPSWVRALSLWPTKNKEISSSSSSSSSGKTTTGGVQTKIKINRQQQREDEAPPAMISLDVNTILDVGLSNYSKISDGTLAPLGSLQKLQNNVGDLDSLVKFLQNSIAVKEADDIVNAAASVESNVNNVATEDEQLEFGNWRNLEALVEKEGVTASKTTADQILFGVSSRLEQMLADTTAVFTPSTMSEMVLNVTGVLFASNADSGGAGLQAAADRIRVAATKIAKDQGLDMDVAAGQAAAVTKYTVDLLQFANNVLNEGYLSTATNTKVVSSVNNNVLATDDGFASSVDKATTTAQSQAALFDGFDASILERSNPLLVKAGEMAAISGAIYLPNILPETLHKYGHAVVANGTTADIAWLVTDSIMYDDYVEGNGSPKLVRTITLRGYDASDANVDRERLVTEVCNATRYSLENNGVDVHIGLMGIAQDLYKELAPFIDQTSSSHKIILNGHSIGGSLSNLLLLSLCMDRGAKYVKDRVANVFTFGSPPVAVLNEPDHVIFERAQGIEGYCGILDAFGLPGSLVQGFLQPWDPVTRLFSEIDALYPLVDDMGEDGLTPWVNGPPRTLRPIVRQLFESLEVWPKMRTNYELTGECKYVFIGTPHLLLPEPSRYLTDRLVSVNLAVPPIDTVLKAEATQLVPMLQKAFPLDEFSISLVSVALRSFIHHFHPAYGLAMEDHVMGNPRKSEIALKEAEKDARESDFVKDIFGIRT